MFESCLRFHSPGGQWSIRPFRHWFRAPRCVQKDGCAVLVTVNRFPIFVFVRSCAFSLSHRRAAWREKRHLIYGEVTPSRGGIRSGRTAWGNPRRRDREQEAAGSGPLRRERREQRVGATPEGGPRRRVVTPRDTAGAVSPPVWHEVPAAQWNLDTMEPRRLHGEPGHLRRRYGDASGKSKVKGKA